MAEKKKQEYLPAHKGNLKQEKIYNYKLFAGVRGSQSANGKKKVIYLYQELGRDYKRASRGL